LFVRAAKALLRPSSLELGGVGVYGSEDRRISIFPGTLRPMAFRLVETRRQEELVETSYVKYFKVSFLVRHPRTTSAFEVCPPVPPKGDLAAPSVRSRSKKKRNPAADDKSIDLKPSARSGSSPPPSAPGGDSSFFRGLTATSQLLLCVLVSRRNEVGTRKAVA
jgi:hypothetical protein